MPEHGLFCCRIWIYGCAVIRERVPGFDPREFWAGPLTPARALDMRDKYEALAGLALATNHALRKPMLRAVARRWPGSLREAELAGPDRVLERLAQAGLGAEQAECSGDDWRARGGPASAVLLWSHLHPLLADLLRFRRVRREPPSIAALARWIADDRSLDERWPAVERLPDLIPGKLEIRCAYLWLTARAGLELPQLNHLLFARSGHWDRRPGDPAWAHDGEPE
jgi:hypothetical protein